MIYSLSSANSYSTDWRREKWRRAGRVFTEDSEEAEEGDNTEAVLTTDETMERCDGARIENRDVFFLHIDEEGKEGVDEKELWVKWRILR